MSYEKIAQAIEYANANFKGELNLNEVAESMNLSPAAFEMLFMSFAGVSAVEFFSSISIGHIKKLLEHRQHTLFGSPARSQTEQHLQQVNIMQLTPAAYKNGGIELSINYSFADSRFGRLLIAATSKGVCYIAYCDEEETGFALLIAKFPNATYVQQSDLFQENALLAFQDQSSEQPIELHLKGTEFQLKVWEALLEIPSGALSTYGKIAAALGNPNASRAVGTAIGSTPIAFLITCHKVVQATGNLGGYMWGTTRKKAIIGFEGSLQGSGVSCQ